MIDDIQQIVPGRAMISSNSALPKRCRFSIQGAYRVCAVLVLLGALSACGSSVVIKQANVVSEAGVVYADALPSLYDESFDLAVRANSLLLERNRPRSATDRQKVLEKQDELMEKRLAVLRDLKQHAILLRSYFVSLRSLAQVDAAPGITEATGHVIDQFAGLRAKLESETLDTGSITKKIGPAVKIAVAKFQSDALRKELQTHAEVIERELALQGAAVRMIGAQMTADKDYEVQRKIRNPVVFTYVDDKPLPPDWADRRLTAYREVVALTTLADATRAADSLHKGWISFAEGALDDGGLDRLVRDVRRFVGLVDAHEAASTKAAR